MSDLEITPSLVGQQVMNPARPEWGTGTVLRVQSTAAGGPVRHRVSVHFPSGHRTLLVPPARLVTPEAEPQREAGWLDTLAGRTIDDRLMKLPEALTAVTGDPAGRLAAMAELYGYDEEPASLWRWARKQVNVGDPLTLWSRDELLKAFRAFCLERDSHLRVLAARLRDKSGPEALVEVLDKMPAEVREAMLVALRRAI